MSNRAQRRRAQRQANKSGHRVRMSDGAVVDPEFVRGPLTGKRSVVTQVPAPAEALVDPGGAAAGRQAGAGPRTAQRPRRSGLGVLDAISEAVSARAAADDAVRQAVAKAREGGESWRAIGEALGVSHVAALKRYGGGS